MWLQIVGQDWATQQQLGEQINQGLNEWANNKEKYDLTENLDNSDFKLKWKTDSDKPKNMKLTLKQTVRLKKKQLLKSSFPELKFSLCSFPDLKKIRIPNRDEIIAEKVQNQYSLFVMAIFKAKTHNVKQIDTTAWYINNDLIVPLSIINFKNLWVQTLKSFQKIQKLTFK